MTHAERTDRYCDDAPTNLAARSFAVVFYDTRKATWERPESTRRYLHGPLAERLLVQWREGKVTLGEVVHDPDWKKMPYEKQTASGVWILHGASEEPLDFRAAKLRVEKDATPIEGGAERELCFGAPDGYARYNPRLSDWLDKVGPSWWEADGVLQGPGDRAFWTKGRDGFGGGVPLDLFAAREGRARCCTDVSVCGTQGSDGVAQSEACGRFPSGKSPAGRI